ncbi:sulfatase [Algoriphagus namhaensis]
MYRFLLLLMTLLLPIASYCQDRPNILFILTDDLGYADLQAYGNPFNLTPHLDQLAKEGMLFTDAYASAPVCSPSRAGLLTGKYPARIGLTDHQGGGKKKAEASVDPPRNWQKGIPSDEYLMSEFLHDQGYLTGMVGKWHVAASDQQQPYHQGFDYSRLLVKNDYDYYHYGIKIDQLDSLYEDDGTVYLTDKLTDFGVDFIEEAQRAEKPFFLYLAYSAPHVILVPRGDKVGKYLWKFDRFGGEYNPYYAAMIESIDDGVGRLIQKLQETGQLENTLIVFTSDNGGVGVPELGYQPTTNRPLRNWKGDTFEGGIRVPTIISWKGKTTPGSTSGTPFNNTDFFATFRNILDPQETNYQDGVSILPALTGEKMPDRAIFWHYPHFSNQGGSPSSAVREGHWKLRVDYDSKEIYLFDLSLDLSENDNKVSEESVLTKNLLEKLGEHLKETQAPMPVDKASGETFDFDIFFDVLEKAK